MAFRTKTVVSGLLAVLFAASAQAGPRPKLAGTLAVSKSSLSGRGPELIKQVTRVSSSAQVRIEHEEGGWPIHYALAVPHSLPSSEITLKVSDISRDKQPKQPVCSRHRVIDGEAAVTRGRFTLNLDQVVSSNARLLFEIESDGVLIAQQVFYIQGKAVTAPKVIEFSAEDDTDQDEDDERAPAVSRCL